MFSPSLQHCTLWLRFIDDVFALWAGPLWTLTEFHHQISSRLPHIKFTLHKSESEIAFLDTLVLNCGDNLKVVLFTKPTDKNTLLHFDSFHPFSTRKSLPKSQFLRVKRIVTDEDRSNRRLDEMQQKFLERGYPISLLKEQRRDVDGCPRDGLPTIEAFHDSPLMSYKKNRTIRSILVKSDIGGKQLKQGHGVQQLKFQVIDNVPIFHRGGDRNKELLKKEAWWIRYLETMEPHGLNREYDLHSIFR
ncbi:hypothetical protein XELAEV_18002052mg [Xenopus laevis]|nr:hypothetical protein XELAEV_18002052mg [Xenopus laevis]